MTDLAPCVHCKQTVARGAPTCPHCGGSHPAIKPATGALAIIGLVLTIAFFAGLAWVVIGITGAMGR